MNKTLVVLRGPIGIDSIHSLCTRVAECPGEVAVCYVLEDGDGSTSETLRIQQRVTAALRLKLGSRAETIAVFVVSLRTGEVVEECARDWGATDVLR